MRHKIDSIAQFLRLAACCVYCNQSFKGPYAICPACTELLATLNNPCVGCALPQTTQDTVCHACRKQRPGFDQILVRYRFEDPLRTVLHEFKYREGLYLRSFMVKLLLDALPENYRPDCLIPMPIHRAKLKQRGFNQTTVLTKALARQLMWPWDGTLCSKLRNTPAQAHLDAKQRQNNMEHAFAAHALPYKHIAVIDDLLTTGNTANALARCLKRQGAERVDIWCCARAT